MAQQRALPMTPWVARASAVDVVRPGPNVRGRAQRSDVAVGGDQIVTALIADVGARRWGCVAERDYGA